MYDNYLDRQLGYGDPLIVFYFDEDQWNKEIEMAEWIDKNTVGFWAVDFLRVGFELEQDAMMYALHFGKQRL